MSAPADWQLPCGVSRAVWEYAHDTTLAADYDAAVAGSPLLDADLAFVREHLPATGRVVDLGCGTGRAALALARAGYAVVGVDLAEPMLQVARAKDEREEVRWACGNIVNLSAVRDHSFDAALCLFSTLGMIAGRTARARAVAEAHRLLRPGGVYIVHAHQPGHHLLTSGGRRWWLRDRMRRLLRRSNAGDAVMPADQGRSGWTMHLFTRRELFRLLRGQGFSVRAARAIDIRGRPLPRLWSWQAYGLLVAAVAETANS